MHTNTVRAIRNRLYLLLLRAFGIVVLIIFIVILATTALVLLNPSQSNPLFRLPITSRLETYYLARGGWDGVTLVFSDPKDFETRQWREGVLLDSNGFVVVDRGVAIPGGFVYTPNDRDRIVPIVVNGALVGQFVVSENIMPPQRRYTFDFLQPVIMVSVFMAILTVVIGLLLTRRMVLPLGGGDRRRQGSGGRGLERPRPRGRTGRPENSERQLQPNGGRARAQRPRTARHAGGHRPRTAHTADRPARPAGGHSGWCLSG